MQNVPLTPRDRCPHGCFNPSGGLTPSCTVCASILLKTKQMDAHDEENKEEIDR
jgi:hypothetical protein